MKLRCRLRFRAKPALEFLSQDELRLNNDSLCGGAGGDSYCYERHETCSLKPYSYALLQERHWRSAMTLLTSLRTAQLCLTRPYRNTSTVCQGQKGLFCGPRAPSFPTQSLITTHCNSILFRLRRFHCPLSTTPTWVFRHRKAWHAAEILHQFFKLLSTRLDCPLAPVGGHQFGGFLLAGSNLEPLTSATKHRKVCTSSFVQPILCRRSLSNW